MLSIQYEAHVLYCLIIDKEHEVSCFKFPFPLGWLKFNQILAILV